MPRQRVDIDIAVTNSHDYQAREERIDFTQPWFWMPVCEAWFVMLTKALTSERSDRGADGFCGTLVLTLAGILLYWVGNSRRLRCP